MSLSNRVSLDTDVLFVRNMFVFSTNTNNVPVSTNLILAIGPNGQMVASNTLYNLSTYGVGYLPSTLSSLNGEIISIGNLVLAGGVIPAQLISVQTALQSSISSTQGSVDTLSSYILLNVIPSTTSTFDSQISSLNSSFQGYVGGTSVTPVQLQSTYTASVDYTNSQISTLSTNTQNQIIALSNYFNVSSATVTQFSSLAGNVSAQSNYFSTQFYLTNSNFNALSAATRVLNISNSTMVGDLENDVSTLTSLVIGTSTVTTPLGTLGLLSTVQCANWPFFSNIKVSSIDVRAAGTAAAPAINFTSGGDTDTGFFHPADGAIAITTNSGERFRFSGAQLIGCNSEVVLNGINQGSITLFPNSVEPQINLNTTSTNGNPYVSWSNTAVNYKTFLSGCNSGGFAAQSQLLTYTYPGANIATAIHSTGNVAIKAAANASNALYVNGSTFINGHLGVSAVGSALTVNGSTIMNGLLNVSSLNVNGSTIMNGLLTVSSLIVNGSTFINGQLGISTAGSATAPSLYFTETGNDTGFFKPGDGAIGITTNGIERFRFSAAQLLGYNSEIVLSSATNAGSITFLPNAANPEINLNTTSTGISPNIGWSNNDVFFRTFLSRSIGSGFAENNQLITYAYPATQPAIAIHSTGTVGIRGAADPTFALTVNGGIRQTEPYIWSYRVSGTISGAYANIVSYNTSNYEPTGLTTPLSNLGGGNAFNIPYDGLYTVTLSYQSLNINTALLSNSAIICSSNLSGGASTILTNVVTSEASGLFLQTPVCVEYCSTFTNNNSIFVYLTLLGGGNAASNVNLKIQYWG